MFALLSMTIALLIVSAARPQEAPPARLMALGDAGLWLVDGESPALIGGTKGIETFAWDRDREHVIATRAGQLLRIDLSDAHITELASGYADLRFPDTAPRSGRIAFAVRSSRALEDQVWRLVITAADGSGARELGLGYDPCWSFDESELFFELHTSDGPALWAIDCETQERRPLFDDGVTRYTVHRGLQSPALMWSSRRGLFDGVPGSSATALSKAGDYDRFGSYSPDQRHWLCFRSEPSGRAGIVIRSLADSTEQWLDFLDRIKLAGFAPGTPPARSIADFEALSRSATNARDLATLCRLDPERYSARLTVLRDQLAAADAPALVLPGVTTLDATEAELLIASQARQLVLPDLRRLDAEVATVLSGWSTNAEAVFLALDGLEEAEPALLRALARTRGWGLSLGGLVSLRSEQVAALSACRAAWLDLRSVRQMDVATAEALLESELKFIDLRGLAEDQVAAREVLALASNRVLLR